MAGPPVVVVPTNGRPVVNVASNAPPYTVVLSNGEPVTIVPTNGEPMVLLASPATTAIKEIFTRSGAQLLSRNNAKIIGR